MAIPRPSQSTPAGCLVGTFALIPAAFGIAGVWGLVKWAQLPVGKRQFDDAFWLVTAATIGGFLLMGGLLWFAGRILRSTNFRGYDSRDPNQKKLHW